MSTELKNKLYLQLVHGNYEIGNDIVEQAKFDTELNCILFLASVGKKRLIYKCQPLLSENQAWRTDNNSAVCYEAKAVAAYIQGDLENAHNHSSQALELNSNAFFPRAILSEMAINERDYKNGIRYYREILDIYPSHNNTLLNLANVLLLAKGDYDEILSYVKKSKKSLRRDLYLFLIPFGKPFARFIWLFIALPLFLIPVVGNYIFLLLTIVLVAIGLVTLKKIGLDVLIITRLFALQIISTLIWMLSLLLSR
ncbi:MAG: hypothetical protein L6461_22550 [Anaerolineae bacterium]|nr:hypothetical protein [Anaerolineae bacterium]